MYRAINPATEEFLYERPVDSAAQVEAKLERAEHAFKAWKDADLATRAARLVEVARLLRARREELARLMALEMGKPLAEGLGEADKSAWACEHFAQTAAAYLKPQRIETDASESFVRYDPLGPLLAVMPWNFPFWQLFRFAAPALMAGNVVLMKHAPNVPGCAEAIEQVFLDAGCAPGVLTNLRIGVETIEDIVAHREVRGVTLTGSVRAGRSLAALAGRELKKSVMELGGADAFIVFPDADLESTAKMAVKARMLNGGQSCIAAKRFFVPGEVAERFEQLFERELAALRVGDPLDPQTQVGPMARVDLLEGLHRQVSLSLEQGASLRLGGHRLERRGFFYAPTLLCDVGPGMEVFEEETFGPVAAVTRVADVEEAIQLANRSEYGLGASLWTSDTEKAAALAQKLEVGHVAINGIVKSDPRLPFGGIKDSGYGRELGPHGILEFVNIKTIWIA